jgi:hypothetical protein
MLKSFKFVHNIYYIILKREGTEGCGSGKRGKACESVGRPDHINKFASSGTGPFRRPCSEGRCNQGAIRWGSQSMILAGTPVSRLNDRRNPEKQHYIFVSSTKKSPNMRAKKRKLEARKNAAEISTRAGI